MGYLVSKGGIDGLERWCLKHAVAKYNRLLDPETAETFRNKNHESTLAEEASAVLYARKVEPGEHLLDYDGKAIPAGYYVSVAPNDELHAGEPVFWEENFVQIITTE